MKEIKKKFRPYYDEKSTSLKMEQFILFEMALMMVVYFRSDADPNIEKMNMQEYVCSIFLMTG